MVSVFITNICRLFFLEGTLPKILSIFKGAYLIIMIKELFSLENLDLKEDFKNLEFFLSESCFKGDLSIDQLDSLYLELKAGNIGDDIYKEILVNWGRHRMFEGH